jgi:hypothetical protein
MSKEHILTIKAWYFCSYPFHTVTFVQRISPLTFILKVHKFCRIENFVQCSFFESISYQSANKISYCGRYSPFIYTVNLIQKHGVTLVESA